MFSVMIVEDEMLVRLGFKNLIDWAKFGMYVLADVSNGQEAWDVYKNQAPDLIITDLKMPVMDGMELIRRIREQDKKTKIIILSCVEEFGLARQAISLGVSDYILKLTMDNEDIERILNKVQCELMEQNCLHNTSMDNKINLDIIKEKALKNFLFYKIDSVQEFAHHVEQYNLRINPVRLNICIMEISHYEQLKARFDDDRGQLVQLSILNCLNEILGNHNRGEAYYDKEMLYILIFSFYDMISEQMMNQQLDTILGNIKNAIEKYFNVNISFGVSSIKSGYEHLASMYNEAAKALECKLYLGNGIFRAADDYNIPDKANQKICMLRSLPSIVGLRNTAFENENNLKIDSFLKHIPLSNQQMENMFYQLLQWAFVALHFPMEDLEEVLAPYYHRIQQCETFEEYADVYKMFLLELKRQMESKRSMCKEVTEAIQYIHQNYERNLSMQEVAEYVQITPNYLSHLFKKDVKKNFTDYLNEFRVEKAKELLINSYLKSYEIAEKVGFTENTYFTKIFKRFVGIAPNEFRKQWKSNWTGEGCND